LVYGLLPARADAGMQLQGSRLQRNKDRAMSEHRLIRKYVNRRLYDTTQSRYVNLDDLRELVTKGVQLKVVEQATGHDITTPVLLQIIAEGQRAGAPLLSPSFLSGLIRLAATGADSDLPARLDRALATALQQAPARSSNGSATMGVAAAAN
jgi:polyhydroxyalkanoate synthesis repressor PhaR